MRAPTRPHSLAVPLGQVHAPAVNHLYRTGWNRPLGVWQAGRDIAEGYGAFKRFPLRGLSLLGALATLPLAVLAQLPTGASVVSGTATVNQSALVMNITQSSPKLITDWQSFGIGMGHTVNFVQPSASAVALNRVIGADVSTIQGTLNANGQVFLVNPNGVLFTASAQVNVGALVASTLALSNRDFLADKYQFDAGNSARARESAIINQGRITAVNGGSVALIAAKIFNIGSITAPGGQVLLGAGSTVALDLGGPVKVVVSQGAIDALIEQGGAIQADGGLIYLSAKAAGDLAATVIKHTGSSRAQTLVGGEKGQIYLMGGIAQDRIEVGGTLDASAPNGGSVSSNNLSRGGFIETSAAQVKVAANAHVTTAGTGESLSGTWLIDPTDFSIAASGGNVTGTTLSANLANTDIEIQTTSGTSGTAGNLYVNEAVTWHSGNTLTLNAHNNILINQTIDASRDTGGKLVLKYGQASADGTVGTAKANYTVASGAKVNLQAGQNFSTQLGNSGNVKAFTVINALGNAGDESRAGATNSLQGLGESSRLSGNYVLGADINATSTSAWNSGKGFAPINSFAGTLDGLGHTIANLEINRTNIYNVGLFGHLAAGSTVRNLGVSDARITGIIFVGILAGDNEGSISNSYATGAVSGALYVGGLTGRNTATAAISDSHVSALVTGGKNQYQGPVGGMVGHNTGIVRNSYATGAVSGAIFVGGLVGLSDSHATVSGSYATGSVTGSGSDVGGLVGRNLDSSAISDSYAIGDVSGVGRVGGLVGINFDNSPIINSYATGAVSGVGEVGGLVGLNKRATVAQSYATGSVTASGNYAGGLVGRNTESSTISNSHATGDVVGVNHVGGLAGENHDKAAINDSHAAGAVRGIDYVGGLAGGNYMLATISGSHATGAVSGVNDVGGLVGQSYSKATVNQSRAAGSVTGSGANAGGLVGRNTDSSTVSQSHATGAVIGVNNVGGLVGLNINQATVAQSYANGSVTGSGNHVGGLVGRSTDSSTVSDSQATGAVSGGNMASERQDGATQQPSRLSVESLTTPAPLSPYTVPADLLRAGGLVLLPAAKQAEGATANQTSALEESLHRAGVVTLRLVDLKAPPALPSLIPAGETSISNEGDSKQ